MLLQLNLVLLCVSGSFAASYDLTQIKDLINSTLTCLEKTPLLNENATFQVSRAMAYTVAISYTVPNVLSETADYNAGLISRLDAFIARSLIAYPNTLRYYDWQSAYWPTRADFTYHFGRMVKRPRLHQTLTQIVEEKSEVQPDVLDCAIDLIVDNPHSDDLRECTARCQDTLADKPPEARAYYIAVQFVSNCSNFSPKEYIDSFTYLCGYMKPEVDAMLRYRNKPQFDDTIYYLMNKVLYCTVAGVGEFLSEDIVSAVIDGIDCNGCVGTSRNQFDQQVLTAETLAVLANIYRLIIEQTENTE